MILPRSIWISLGRLRSISCLWIGLGLLGGLRISTSTSIGTPSILRGMPGMPGMAGMAIGMISLRGHQP